MTSQMAGPPTWMEALHQHLVSHVASEGELLDAYQKAADDAESPALSYLVQLIIDDEVRHHQIFRALADTLQNDMDWSHQEPVIPRLDPWDGAGDQVVALSKRLLACERRDLRELRRLEHELKGFKETTLWSLLVETMQIDTRKHIHILDFVRRHSKGSHG